MAIQNNLSTTCIAKRISRLRQMGLIPKCEAQNFQQAESFNRFIEIVVPASTAVLNQKHSVDVACRIELANINAIIITNSISPALLQKFWRP